MNYVEKDFLRERRSPAQICLIRGDNLKDFKKYTPIAQSHMRGGQYAGFGVTVDQLPRGAVELRKEKGYLDLLSLQVEDSFHRQKLGSLLLKKAKEYALECGLSKIYAEYMFEKGKSDEVTAFFLSNGFEEVETGNTLFTFPISALAGSEIYQKMSKFPPVPNTVPMNRLPGEVEHNFEERIRSGAIPSELSPAQAKGVILEDLSQGVLDGKEIGAYLILTDFRGRLYINSAYTDQKHRDQLIRLLAQSLRLAVEKYSKYGEMCVTSMNHASFNLIQKMVGADSENVKKETVIGVRWDAEQELLAESARADSEGALVAGQLGSNMEILVPMLMRLSDFLREKKLDSDLLVRELPVLLLDIENTAVTLTYAPIDIDAGRFSLTASAFLPTALSEDQIDRACADFNRNTLYSTAIRGDTGIVIRYTLPENSFPITKEQFSEFIDVFLGDVALAHFS